MLRLLHQNYKVKLFNPSLTRKFSEHIVKSKYPFDFSAFKNVPFGKFILDKLIEKPSIAKQISMVNGETTESITFEDQHRRCYIAACEMRHQLGVSKGVGVAIISPNHMNYFPILVGVSIAGGYSIPINPLCSETELLYQLELAEAKIAFVHPNMMSKVVPIAKNLNIKVLSIDKQAGDVVGNIDTFPNLISSSHRPKLQEDVAALASKSFDVNDIAVVPFSSGTTGKMKGVMLTHSNIMSNLIQAIPIEGKYMENSRTGAPGVCLTPLPFFHIFAMTMQLFVGYYTACTVVFLPAFDLKLYLRLIKEHKATRLHLVPPIALALAKHPMVDEYDLSSVECIMSGAAPLGGDIQEACAARLKCIVKQAWGMTELAPAGSSFADEEITSAQAIKGKSGFLVAGTEGKVVDPVTGADLPYAQEGEILIRGPQVMKGYLKNEEATRATIRPDGWLHTGDIGYFDKDGALIITDRCKELIKYKGCQVPPAELEAVIITMPEIKDAIVIPVLDDEAGEIPRAYVVKQDGCPASFTEEDVVAYVNSKVSPQKKLRGGVRFTASIPKSASGKLLRRIQVQIDRGEITV